MTQNNAQSETRAEPLDVQHELPPSEEEKSSSTQPGSQVSGTQQAAAERDDLLDRVARMQAEFENARKRTAREQQEYKSFALGEALGSLLPVLDSFDRAMRAPAQNLEEFRSGVELIQKQLDDALSKLGLRRIPAEGEVFDPLLHEAVEMVDSTDAEDNRVTQELQRGYKLRDRLLRPAMVRVARSPQK